jgi:hypothetical protein
MSLLFDDERSVYVFQAGGNHEHMRERGWPDSMKRHSEAPVGGFQADWMYYQIIALTHDEDAGNLPDLGIPWRFHGVLQEATRPEILRPYLNDEAALADLRSKGWHIYKRYYSNAYYRAPSDHPDLNAPPYPNGAEKNPAKPVEMSPAAKRYLDELLRK